MAKLRKLLLTVAGIFLLVAAAHAQSGKIVGVVTDQLTGDPLPGVNVVIEGTTQGASTGLDGDYVIIGVRPGDYTLVASFIGFATKRVTGVKVSLDLTTTINFELSEEVLEGEEIVVVAEAIAVKKDLTSSEARVTSDTIDKLPVTELGQILDVQAGITSRDGLHIRGGRSSEIVYMVDGVPVTDSYDGSASIQIENDGIEELQVVSGTFNAEFGNAMSGVINVVTKEGRSDRFGGSAKVYTGSYLVFGDGGKEFLRGTDAEEFTSAGIQYRDVDPYSYLSVDPTHYYNANVSIEGPVIKDRVTLFALGRYFKNDGWLYGSRLFYSYRDSIDGRIVGPGTSADSALVPMNTFEKYSWQGNVRILVLNNLIVNLIGLGSYAEGRPYDFGRRWAPDGRSRDTDFGYDTKVKITHLLSNTTFYTLDVATFYRKAEARLFDDINDPRYNDFNINVPDTIPSAGTNFLRGGTNLGRFSRSTRSYMFKGDLSSQLGSHHLVKTGVQVRLDDLAFEAFGLIPDEDEEGNSLIGADFVPTPPPTDDPSYNSFDNVKPVTVSAYIQDKIEYEDFIVNAGVRLDWFDPRARAPADPNDPNIFSPLTKENQFRDENGDGVINAEEERDDNRIPLAERESYWWTNTESRLMIAPRLGVGYPITEQGVIHFSFGLFYQIPTLNNLFDNFGYKVPSLSGQYGLYGNPELEPQRTSMFEIGFKQGFGDFVLDVTGYYRDIRNWVGSSPPIQTGLAGVSYFIYANRDYANTRGVTVSFNKKYRDHWGFDASYTFQIAEGSNSNPADEFFSSLGNNQPTLALLPLGWDQRHKIGGALYVGGDLWGASMRYRFESGFPYTPGFAEAALVGNDVRPEFASNSRRMASTWEVDLSAYKEFEVGTLKPRIFVEVYNLLDRRNVANVFSDTGEPDLTLFQLQTGAFDPGFWVRPENYREPRRIQLGLEFRF